MRPRRNTNLLVEPPSCATGDIAFNLIVFFLVCASVAPDSGRKQMLPRSEETKQQQEKSENVEVSLTRSTVSVNGEPLKLEALLPKLQALFANKPRPEDRVVIVKSKPDTPYHFWIEVTAVVEAVGGTVTIQREEEQTVIAN